MNLYDEYQKKKIYIFHMSFDNSCIKKEKNKYLDLDLFLKIIQIIIKIMARLNWKIRKKISIELLFNPKNMLVIEKNNKHSYLKRRDNIYYLFHLKEKLLYLIKIII